MKKKAGISTVFLASMLLTACGTGGESSSSGEEGNGGSSSKEESEETRTVDHEMGTTEIEGTPEKVVTLYQGANDTAAALDVEPVGIVESWTQQPIYKYLRDDLEGTETVGEEIQPNLEKIAEMDPDVIIANKSRHEDIYDDLSAIAPTVTTDQVYEWKDTLELTGEVLNKEQEADELLSDYEARTEHFQEEMGDELPIEVAITNFRADHARIFYMGFAGSILQDTGFDRPEGHEDTDEWGIKLSSKESIPEADAEMIFNFNSGTETEQIEETYEEWTSHPLWQELEAVENDEVHMVEEETWNAGGGIMAANLMLDDLYETFDIEEEK
ncbi:iron complex transport system substrate-binding protein [Marinococcus luteus]|uniref:Iron complex transport system substrate-binding protein n=1 Tax=Marinococcus luteus TaxID=1122204 RepID=A0A1H2RJJ5_9BACI|nr:iron-siderophore ABC transporter substrate-binding protein [Marinococcus luteus]SDW19475.1 iron complex transport system substrate-binding protein [Marinococcus luteus]